MKIPAGKTFVRAVGVAAFLGGSIAIFAYLMNGAGFRLPWIQPEPYHAAVEVADVDNLVELSQVRIAGVPVGDVQKVSLQGPGEPTKVEFSLNEDAAPLHEGATFRIGERSPVGESYLEIVDGKGAEVDTGTTFPERAVQRSTQVRDVLASIDPKTRKAMRGMILSVDRGTRGTKADVSNTLTGLGNLGREGHTALDAISAQSQDLRVLASQTTTLLRALDTREGQIVTMVDNAHRLTQSTAGQRASIENAMRQLPGTLRSAQKATGALSDVSGALSPVAADLNRAAPFLNTALQELPATTADLRQLLPSLDGALRRAPATLDRVPMFGQDVRSVIPEAELVLRDINPVLQYLKPYGRDFGAYIANFNAALAYTDEAGNHYLRLIPKVNERSVESPLSIDGLTYKNPIAPPGAGGDPGPFTGKYPHVERAPR